jgi:hypothetical protein
MGRLAVVVASRPAPTVRSVPCRLVPAESDARSGAPADQGRSRSIRRSRPRAPRGRCRSSGGGGARSGLRQGRFGPGAGALRGSRGRRQTLHGGDASPDLAGCVAGYRYSSGEPAGIVPVNHRWTAARRYRTCRPISRQGGPVPSRCQRRSVDSCTWSSSAASCSVNRPSSSPIVPVVMVLPDLLCLTHGLGTRRALET